MITPKSSTRSMSSTTSSECSDDPAMKKTTRTAPRSRRSDNDLSNADTTRKSKVATVGRLDRATRSASISVVKRNRCHEVTNGAAVLTTRKRKVCFSATLTKVVAIVDHRDDLTDEEKDLIYMSAENVQRIREDAKFVTKYFRTRSKELIVEIDQAYCSALTLSTNSYTYEEFLAILDNKSPTLIKAAAPLNNWCSKAKVSGRGLERYCSSKQRNERSAFASECRKAVIRLCKNPGINDDDIATFYQEYARSCTLFSRMLGQQDQLAAEEAYVQMARKEKALNKKHSLKDIVVHPTTLSRSTIEHQEIAIAPRDASDSVENDRNMERRRLLLKTKQQSSSSARHLLERLGQRVGSNRVIQDTTVII